MGKGEENGKIIPTKLDSKKAKMSKSSQNLRAWMALGNMLPKCINLGCEKAVAIRHWSIAEGSLLPSLKTECSTCANARIKGRERVGITIVKKHYCENHTGVLGFACPMDPIRYTEFPMDCYHMDHKDGNHENNVPENIITLCAICHTRKGRESGDFNSTKKTSRKVRKSTDPSSDASEGEMLVETASTSSQAIVAEVLLSMGGSQEKVFQEDAQMTL